MLFKKVSIIIPVWNGSRLLRACLDALAAQTPTADGLLQAQDVEIIAVDNGSLDHSADFIAQHYPQVHLVRLESNRGYAGGCNQGYAVAQGEIVIFLNQDTVVQTDWLSHLVRPFGEPNVGIVGCKSLYFDGKTIQHAGMRLEWPRLGSAHLGYKESDVGQYDDSHAVECVTGAALAIRRELFQRLNGFDEGFWPGYFEDTDLCLRVHALGYMIWYAGDAVLLHQESASINNLSTRKALYQIGRLRLCLKTLSPQVWLTSFYTAERAALAEMAQAGESAMLQVAYFQAAAAAPKLLAEHWQADPTTIVQVLERLQALLREVWLISQQTMPQAPQAALADNVAARSALLTGELTDIEFMSPLPVVGPLIAAFRRFWYNIAARWGIMHLRDQQQQINQLQMAQLQYLNNQVMAQQSQILMLQTHLLTFMNHN